MSNMEKTVMAETNNPCDIFVRGATKGFNLVVNNLIPNIVMAYVLTMVLNVLGVFKILSAFCGPVMGIFGLPGDAIIILLTTWLSSSSAIGVTAGMVAAGQITPEHVTIIMPAYFLLNAQIQYMGRLLAVAGVPSKYWPLLMLTSALNACCAMLIMHWFVV